jgi:transcriptional regulator with XRE-family HTH domain
MTDDYASKIQAAIVTLLMEELKKQGVSHEKLAIKAGISRTAISHLESGRSQPSLRVSINISNALGISFSELARQTEKRIKR